MVSLIDSKIHYTAVEFYSLLFHLFDFAKTNISKLQRKKKIPHEKMRRSLQTLPDSNDAVFFWL